MADAVRDRADRVRETDIRFWELTGYKPGQRLNPRDPRDAKMALVWLDVYRQVLREHMNGEEPPPASQLVHELTHDLATLPPSALPPAATEPPVDMTALPSVPSSNSSSQSSSSDFSPIKALLLVGGGLVVLGLGRFLFIEGRAYVGAVKMRRSWKTKSAAP